MRVVVFQQDGWWVAQCLEYDIVTVTRKLSDLHLEVERFLLGHFVVAKERGRTPFEGLPKAPKRYWDLFATAADRIEPVVPSRAALDIPWVTSPPHIEARIAA